MSRSGTAGLAVLLLIGALAGGAVVAGRGFLGGVLGTAGSDSVGVSAPNPAPAPVSPGPTSGPAVAGAAGAPGGAVSSPPTTAATVTVTTPATVGTAVADRTGLNAQDRIAGLRSLVVPQRGTGRLVVVPGSVAAPGRGAVKRVRVEVEGGLDVDGAAFAAFVMSTLNDPRSWGHGGRMTFARTAGPADIRVVLASPRTSEALCAPLRTMGTLSCGVGSTAVLTLYRWVKAIPGYGGDRTGYRHYVVNHEVGHTLGHGHQQCPGTGRRAPVMMQQTKGLKGCLPNGWPYP